MRSGIGGAFSIVSKKSGRDDICAVWRQRVYRAVI